MAGHQSPRAPLNRHQSACPYRAFWTDVGETFPDLGGAASTSYYRNNEIRLLTEHLPALEGKALLKTDLWDEAKNTRILAWACGQGARVYGVDIALPIARRARTELGTALRAVAADVRTLPFAEQTFDIVYSMGTIEHFPDPETAVTEIFRVLKRRGRAIVGVPNLHDPFLRPLLVVLLRRAGLYAYGDERAFSRRGLRAMLEAAGFEVVAEPAILFMPGWLRMLDLWCHHHAPAATRATAAAVRAFAALDRALPFVRRYGYLLATVVVRP